MHILSFDEYSNFLNVSYGFVIEGIVLVMWLEMKGDISEIFKIFKRRYLTMLLFAEIF
jgi:hypothetical protein